MYGQITGQRLFANQGDALAMTGFWFFFVSMSTLGMVLATTLREKDDAAQALRRRKAFYESPKNASLKRFIIIL